MKKKKIIGFDRKIELEWIDYTAYLVSRGLSASEMSDKLVQKLSVYNLGTSKGGALSKTITVLTRIWSNVPEDIIPLRDKAIDLYKSVSSDERKVLHICLTVANYPFFFDVLTQIGRLLKLQDTFSSDQITRRIIEQWGDTERVKRSVRHVLLTLKLWGIIEPLKKRSLYSGKQSSYVHVNNVQSFIDDALKISLGNSISIEEYSSHPAMFFCKW